MKKFLVILLSFILAIGVAGCAATEDNEGGNQGNEIPPVTDPEPTPPVDKDDTPFTVSLWDVEDDAEFKIYSGDKTTALWTSRDDGSITEAAFNGNGVATAEGLDGDYTVTLDNLPEGYAYNPNVCVATNDERAITVPVYPISKASGKGTGWYNDAFKLDEGVYRFTLNSASQKVYCTYAPSATGEYVIETWADITANEINPRIDVHMAAHSVVQSDVMEQVNYTDDAPSSVFTKNFRYRISAYSDVFVCAFELMCDSRVGYPVDVDIRVARASDYDFGEDEEYELYIPTEEFEYTPEYFDERFRYIYEDDANNVLRGESVAFNSSDGYYHVVQGGVMTDKILYAKIKGNIIAPNGGTFMNLQTASTGDDGSSAGPGGDGAEVTRDRVARMYINGWNYTFMIRGYAGLVASDYPGAANYRNRKSYVDYVNSDGVYAVTQELKEYLQLCCSTAYYFYDGYGVAEECGYNSSDPDQWLFACGYYQ